MQCETFDIAAQKVQTCACVLAGLPLNITLPDLSVKLPTSVGTTLSC